MDELTLEQKIELCDMEVQKFIVALKSENHRLQNKIAKLQAELVTAKNRIEILESYEKRFHEMESIPMSPDEIDTKIKELAQQIGQEK